ncbi:MAG: hypothetical protein AAGA25_13540 [Planctomycetota bacterium]
MGEWSFDGGWPPEMSKSQALRVRYESTAGPTFYESIVWPFQGDGGAGLSEQSESGVELSSELVTLRLEMEAGYADRGTFALEFSPGVPDRYAGRLAGTPRGDLMLRVWRSQMSGSALDELIAAQDSDLLTWDDAVRLYRAGVSGDWLAQLRSPRPVSEPKSRVNAQPVSRDYSVDDIVSIKRNGLDPNWIASWQAIGYGDEIRDLITIKRNGLKVDRAIRFTEAFNRLLSIDELIRIKRNGLSADEVAGFHRTGYDLTINQAVTLKQNGIKKEFAEEMNQPGFQLLGIDELITLKRNGISPELVRKLRPAREPEEAS